jgi:hypothetical protein
VYNQRGSHRDGQALNLHLNRQDSRHGNPQGSRLGDLLVSRRIGPVRSHLHYRQLNLPSSQHAFLRLSPPDSRHQVLLRSHQGNRRIARRLSLVRSRHPARPGSRAVRPQGSRVADLQFSLQTDLRRNLPVNPHAYQQGSRHGNQRRCLRLDPLASQPPILLCNLADSRHHNQRQGLVASPLLYPPIQRHSLLRNQLVSQAVFPAVNRPRCRQGSRRCNHPCGLHPYPAPSLLLVRPDGLLHTLQISPAGSRHRCPPDSQHLRQVANQRVSPLANHPHDLLCDLQTSRPHSQAATRPRSPHDNQQVVLLLSLRSNPVCSLPCDRQANLQHSQAHHPRNNPAVSLRGSQRVDLVGSRRAVRRRSPVLLPPGSPHTGRLVSQRHSRARNPQDSQRCNRQTNHLRSRPHFPLRSRLPVHRASHLVYQPILQVSRPRVLAVSQAIRLHLNPLHSPRSHLLSRLCSQVVNLRINPVRSHPASLVPFLQASRRNSPL